MMGLSQWSKTHKRENGALEKLKNDAIKYMLLTKLIFIHQ